MNPIEWSDEGRTELFAAYVKAQAEMGAVFKGAVNPAFKSKYADLATVIDAVAPAFNKNGLAIIQSPSFDGEVVTLETIIAHTGGGFMRSALSIRPAKQDAHGIGSAVTYARRYALLALSGVAPEDDDGNASSGPQEPARRFGKEPSGRDMSAAAQAVTAGVNACGTLEELKAWKAKNAAMLNDFPPEEADAIVRLCNERSVKLRAREMEDA